ncbi:MAG: alpha/beta hydrolase family protein [Sphaerochaetaceae bacterium]
MKYIRTFFVVSILLFFLGCTTTHHTTTVSFDGFWKGSIEVAPSQHIELGFVLNDENPLYFIPPQQGVVGQSLDYEVEGESVLLEMKHIGALFSGNYHLQEDVIEGVFSQMGYDFPLVLARSVFPKTGRFQDPVDPTTYTSEDIVFTQMQEDFTLAGTLTKPLGEGPFPAVVLISGSGSQDRDESLFGHRPFLVLADALSSNGIVVLRFDDRGVGDSLGDSSFATSEDLSYDVEAALNTLLNLSYVDPVSVGLIGHSEGSLLAFMVASRNEHVSFIVSMAGMGAPGMATVLDQNRALLEAQGIPLEYINQSNALNQTIYNIALDSHVSLEEKQEHITTILTQVGMDEMTINMQLEALLSPWYRAFLETDPADYIQHTTSDVLILNGTLDKQVTSTLHVPLIESALEQGGHQNYTTIIYDSLNHLFQKAESGSIEEYPLIETTIEEFVLEDITHWILNL